MFLEIGALQEGVVPDVTKPITYESLVEQYEAQARKACRSQEQPEDNWRAYAEIWAGTDMEGPGELDSTSLSDLCTDCLEFLDWWLEGVHIFDMEPVWLSGDEHRF
jgi:hypothetical protein